MRIFHKTNTGNNWFWRTLSGFVLAFVLTVYPAAIANADTFDEQIKALQQEAQGYQQQAAQLRAQADTLQNAIAAINAQQAGIQVQIEQTQVKLDQLNQKITETEDRIDSQKDALSLNLKSLYIESSITSLEMIASSDSISDFVNKQEYRNKINDSIASSLKTIKQLKITLESQKTDVTRTLEDQKAMKGQLAKQEAEKNNLLAQTQGQEAAYQQVIGQKNSQIASLRAAQKAVNLKSFSGNIDYSKSSAYPWPNASMDYDDSCRYYGGGSGADPWGYCYRQCTSYVAWKLAKNNASNFENLGHAGMWAYSGESISTRSSRSGDVLVWPVGGYGHVMYVESVSSDGIYVSEFNYAWDGRYSERFISWGQIDSGGYKTRRF